MDKVPKFLRLKRALDALGYPVAYHHFDERVEPPFVVYYSPNIVNVKADNKIYHQFDEVDIEVYTDSKDFALEQKMHKVLTGLGIIYDKKEVYVQEENLFMQVYEIQI